ncbi:uncharacterized protein LOC129408740 [Boleophthalmus pectinirostris]|uniref:uncharacterized protein LOC129408740 n=1 Tax=Boleophthalmus pectinirostris TaxID=150288 RepID=UPI0024323CC1|nr:uncharacterized protein LOC129408740 [Boleophthalmus pectinirostris]
MMGRAVTVFLWALIPVVQAQSLTSSEPVVTSPGQSVSLSCKVEGLSLAWLHWIRQKPGRGLDWIGRIDSGTGTIFAQSVQGQFSITKDTSTNTVYLQLHSAKEGDTAVYYCAREAQWCRELHSCVKCETLTQPTSVTVQPGHTLTIPCTVSYSVSSYATHWIRQPAGKGLEWIGRKYTGGSDYKDSLKSKFSIDLDTSTKTVTLNGQNMQPGDTAVYYCAREPQSHKVYVELYKNSKECNSQMKTK